MSKASLIFAFSLGAAAGVAVSWKLLETKYAQIADEAIESVKERFTVPREGGPAKIKEEKIIEETPLPPSDETVYEEIASQYKSAGKEESDEKEEEEDMAKPYVISPDEFDENGYKTVSLTYWADGILTDQDHNVIKNVEKMVGENPEPHFGEYEDDSVFVRDDKKKTDYEILKDMRKFKDLKKPYFDPSDEVED